MRGDERDLVWCVGEGEVRQGGGVDLWVSVGGLDLVCVERGEGGGARFVGAEELAGEDDVPGEVGVLRLKRGSVESGGRGSARTMSTSSRTLPFDSVPMMACFLRAYSPGVVSGQPSRARLRQLDLITGRSRRTIQPVPDQVHRPALLLAPHLPESLPLGLREHAVEDQAVQRVNVARAFATVCDALPGRHFQTQRTRIYAP